MNIVCMESCPSWSKEHDWKSCKLLKRFRGFESLALRQRKRQVSTETCRFQFYSPYGELYCYAVLLCFAQCYSLREF